MLQKTKAAASLEDACRRLGLPLSTAAALLQFLSVKRTHDDFVDAPSKQLRMSPGAKLDTLWHCMLLNTAVSTLVHAQLGGVVEHRGFDSTDLSDGQKLLQRLYALNIMKLEGRLRDTDLELWQEPGTAMHTLLLTATPAPGLQSLPGGGRLYVTPTLTQQQQAQLVEALQQLYAEDVPDAPVDPENRTQSIAAAAFGAGRAAAAGAAAAGRGAAAGPAARATRSTARAAGLAAADTAPAAGASAKSRSKRARAEPSAAANKPLQSKRHAQQGAAGRVIEVTVCNQMGAQLLFKVKGSTQMGLLYQAVAQRWEIEPTAIRLLFFGERPPQDATVDDLDMEDGDVINCIGIQSGC